MRFASDIFDNSETMGLPIGFQNELAILPAGEQGPAQGPNIPIKNYGGVYMPDATQPSGYVPGPGRV